MQQIDQTGPLLEGPDSTTTASFVDAPKMGVYAFDTRDVMGAGDAARVMIAGCRSRRQALRRIRHAGFRVYRWSPQLAILPLREASLAARVPRVVMWRSHDPEVSGQWFTMPH
jgi:hypothetical protein